MAARLRAALLLAAVALLSACGGGAPAEPRPAPPAEPVATPVASLTAGMAGTYRLLRDAVERAGLRIAPTARPVRPSEPDSLAAVPRAALQVDLGDPDAGWVIVYEPGDPGRAQTEGRAFAAYLASGFGQTNYPLDARFALSQVAGTLVFTWYSPERSADRAKAQAAFDAVASVGQPIPVLR